MVDLNLQSARRQFLWLAAISSGLGLLSAWDARDHVIWALEALPVFVIAGLVWRLGWTPSVFLGRWMFFHALVLIVGAHYTYAEVPAGAWLAERLGQTRNPYDRLGHLMQGVVPALMIREWLLRGPAAGAVSLTAWAGICFAGAFSAAYEIFEWGSAILLGQAADAFLGSQGFVWDTQADMLCAFLGAAFAMWALGPWHRRSLAELHPAACTPLSSP